MKRLAFRLSMIATLLAPPTAFATIWHVTPDGTGDAPSIQAAINLATPSDTVQVARGTYYESDIEMRDGIRLFSETQTPDCVTIDALGAGSVIRCVGTDTLATIAGFTLTGGNADYGGGLYLASASNPRIRDCRIIGNTAVEGGGLYLLHSIPRLERCEIRDNVATAFGGAMTCASTSFPVLIDCTISGNSAGDYGGAIASFFYTGPELIRCTLSGNSAGSGGGAIMTLFANVVLRECVLSGNLAGDHGGALFLEDTHPVIEASTITGNRAVSGSGGGIFLADDIDLDLTEVILWGNSAPDGAQAYVAHDTASLVFACSAVDTTDGWFGGPGTAAWVGSNLAADPAFCSPEPSEAAPTTDGDYGLQPGSPALALGGACGTVVGGVGLGSACSALSAPLPSIAAKPVAMRSYPNPFRGSTTLEFDVPATGAATVRIYDAAGRLVRHLGEAKSGRRAVTWDGRDEAGRPVAAGVYFSRLDAGTRRGTARLVVLR